MKALENKSLTSMKTRIVMRSEVEEHPFKVWNAFVGLLATENTTILLRSSGQPILFSGMKAKFKTEAIYSTSRTAEQSI
jgi:hypothetical protein